MTTIAAEALEAVAIDSSAFGKDAPLDVEQVEEWAGVLARHGVELWLPEPVLWELVVHVYEPAKEAHDRHARVVKILDRARLPAPKLGKTPTPRRFLARATKEIAGIANVEVVPCAPKAAVAGIKDQILGTGAGRKKKDVRTGASDSAWVRTVHERAGGRTDTYAIVAGDRKDIEAVYRDLGVDPPPIFRSFRDLRRVLVPPQGLVPRTEGELMAFMLANVDDLLEGLTSIRPPDGMFEPGGDLGEPVEVQVVVGRVLGIAGVRNIEFDKISDVVGVSVLVVVDLDVTAWRYDPVAERLVSDLDEASSVVLDLPVLVHSFEGDFVHASLEDEPYTMPEPGWDAPERALVDCVAVLALVPYLSREELTVDRLRDGWSGNAPNGRPVRLVLEVDVPTPGEWLLTCAIGEERVALSPMWSEREHWIDFSGVHVVGARGAWIAPPWIMTEFLIRAGYEDLEQ